MEIFSVKFRAGSLDLNAIVTEHDHHQKFKVELVTEEPEPILLTRSINGEWTVTRRGTRNFSESDFDKLQKVIEAQLKEIYGVKRMLVLTDFSDAASNAASYAAAMAHQLNTKMLMLYHSYEPAAVPAAALAPLTGEIADSPELIREKITELKNRLKELIPFKTKIEVRADERNLLRAVNILAGQHHFGLVVTGITGKSRLKKALIGSNTIGLAKDCSVPLLIVPPEAVFQTIKKVVFACDLKPVSETIPILAIKTFIHALGARLLILNVEYKEKRLKPDTIKEIAELHEIWGQRQVEYHYIAHEDVARGIMEFADQQQAEMVITVPRQYGFFESIFHRSTTMKLAFHSSLPLLLFREDL